MLYYNNLRQKPASFISHSCPQISLSPAQRSCKRPQRRWQVSAGPPSLAWAVASGGPPSQHIPGWHQRHSGRPGAVPLPSAVPAGRSGASSARKWHERGTGHEGRRERSVGAAQVWYGRGGVRCGWKDAEKLKSFKWLIHLSRWSIHYCL